MGDTSQSLDDFPSTAEQLLHRFEEAWQGEARPDLADFLPTPRIGDTRLLIELVHIDLEFRLRRGESARVEHYLERFPGLDRDAVLDLIAAEYILRRHWQTAAAPEEFLKRFPQYRADLEGRLDAGADPRPTAPADPGGPAEIPLFPGYRLLRELGRGGMGVVYQVRQTALGRTVALKMIPPGQPVAADEVEWFRREAEAMARLDHPHVVPVYEVGDFDGRPYFTMKHFPGGSLARRLRGPSADPAGHARLVEAIARAVHHAHQRGVLHRDLKPSNILLDEAGRPCVADFGLAKRFDPAVGGARGSRVVGTPSYLAPEQAEVGREVTTAADVYGLGAILYECLTGEPPFLAETALSTLRQAAERAPRRPGERNPRARGDLETICLKCLEKDPARRYASAEALADDLARYLKGEPIQARPVGVLERAWLWARRHPVAAALAAVALLALVTAVGVLTDSNVRIADREAKTAEALHQERQARDREQRLLYLDRVALAGRLWSLNELPSALPRLDECPPQFRHLEWHFLNARRRPHLAHLDLGAQVFAQAYSRDGQILAVSTRGGDVRLWDAETGEPLDCAIRHGGAICLAFGPDGLLATAAADGVRVWDVRTGKERYRVAGGFWVAFSPDRRHAASSRGNEVHVWDARTGDPVRTLRAEVKVVRHGAFSPDSQNLAVCGPDEQEAGGGCIQVWEVAGGTPVGATRRYDLPVLALAYAGADVLAAQASAILVTEGRTGRVKKFLRASPSARARLHVSADGRYLAYTARDRTVRVWDLGQWREGFLFRGHTGEVTALAFHPGGRRLASGGKDQAVKIWALNDDGAARLLPGPGMPAGGLTFGPRGRLAAAAERSSATKDGEELVLVLDAATGREAFRLRGRNDVVFGPGGNWLATAKAGGGIDLWDADTGRHTRTLVGPGAECYRLAVSDRSPRLACGCVDGTIAIWDPDSGTLLHSWKGHSGQVGAVAVHPNGAALATAGLEGGLVLWDADGTRRRTVGKPSVFRTAAYSPDGKTIAAAGLDQVIHLWDAATGVLLRSLPGHTDAVRKVVFTQDGQRLVSAGADGTVRFWDVETGRELLTLGASTAGLASVAVSTDGRQFAAAGRAIQVWEVIPK